MINMKKVIKDIAIVNDISEIRVSNEVIEYISKWQNKGYEVDIQYSANNDYYSVFLTAYKMEVEKV